ncbi:cysteine desulfurase family protein [Butyrivibrio sp. AE3004]|uniref:cysteine desulfurase family protein n=1 Tax=Butyrivibrio sp. AE3004 TaxID=1506994 RepID=UPI000561D24A|nr:cysteine desulfurase family protein [Butyrivibrio sp. AE3004]
MNKTDKQFIYLDNSATTPLYPEVLDAMLPYLTASYGNPSSLYPLGRKAHAAIEHTRSIIASLINASPEEIYFTSGATESNNWVFYMNADKKCLCTAIEHASVINQPNIFTFNVTQEGFVDTSMLDYTLMDNPFELVSTMLANNEIGSIQDIQTIGEICHKHNVKYHVDATQGLCYLPIDVKKSHIDYLSASAHKIHGPKGVGFLYINKDENKDISSDITPLMYGGGQEQGLRPGTENVAGIVGFGKAIEVMMQRREDDLQKLTKLRNYMHYQIMNTIDDVEINGTYDFDRRLPGNLNYCFADIKSDELVEMLSEKGIYCSTGSACHNGSGKPSHVLKAIGLTDKQAMSSVRFSLGPDLDKTDIDVVVQTVINCVYTLRKY